MSKPRFLSTDTLYSIHTFDVPRREGHERNLDDLPGEVPACPLCGAAHIELEAMHGVPNWLNTEAWVRCSLGHLLRVVFDYDNPEQVVHHELVDKPRRTFGHGVKLNFHVVYVDENLEVP